MPITVTEAVLGCKKEIPTLYGNINLTIPSGSNTGDKQRIKGKGVDNRANRSKGDMYIVLDVRVPKKYHAVKKVYLKNLMKLI